VHPRDRADSGSARKLYSDIGAPCENEPALTALWFHINELAAWAEVHQAYDLPAESIVPAQVARALSEADAD
jgi:hypothetical protein